MASVGRKYTEREIKLLFGLSGNQCAHPDCTNPIISSATPESDKAVLGQICHIYAAADNGPRGKPGLTEDERNGLDNLILLCGHHHILIDKQHETYPAETLKNWKQSHEAKFQQETAEAFKCQAAIQRHKFFQHISDQQIEDEVERIRKARFLSGFSSQEEATRLAIMVEDADLSGGTTLVRAKALAQCARYLSLSDVSRSRELLTKSRQLGICEEAQIAEAFIISTTDKTSALRMLALINSQAARSAALRIVRLSDGQKEANLWVQRADIKFCDFDSEGKYLHLTNLLETEEWNYSAKLADQVAESDLSETPILLYAVAYAKLLQAVPEQDRTHLLSQVPFQARGFPLAADEIALSARREAASLFTRLSDFAQLMGVAKAANLASDMALWLKLRDPAAHLQGLEELRASMRNYDQSLRRVNLALQFGIDLDADAIEQEIERRIALSGKGGADEAYARLSLVFAQDGPSKAADYIALHRELLYEHLQKRSIQMIEIELHCQCGKVQSAKDMLAVATADGLSDKDQQRLLRIIAEAEGADPASERKRMFEETGEIRDLTNLVRFLEEQNNWYELHKYGELLFEKTRAIEDFMPVVRSLEMTSQHARLFEQLSKHRNLIKQSVELKRLWAWSLFREGHFDEASAVLNKISADRDDANDRQLRVNIAISTGRWDELVEFTNSEWNRRAHRSANEMLSAGQLAQSMNAPHAFEFIKYAAELAPDNPNILASAYFISVQAGWEQTQAVSEWLTRAAELSGEDGPIKSVSMHEIVNLKPNWDKHEERIWKQLNDGGIPAIGAARLLNRSLIEFLILQSLANKEERDPRRRSNLFAFSGARQDAQPNKFDSLGVDIGTIITLARLELLEEFITTYKAIFIPASMFGWLFSERQRAMFHQPSKFKDAHLISKLVTNGSLKILQRPLQRDLSLIKEVGTELADLLVTARDKTIGESATRRYVIRSSPVHKAGSLMAEEAELSNFYEHLCSCQTLIAKLRSKGALTLEEERQALSYLKLHERKWPSEPEIVDGAELYLDGLSITYLMATNTLHKLKSIGLVPYILEDELTQSSRLIELEGLAQTQNDLIESIRYNLSRGMNDGRVFAVRARVSDENDEVSMQPVLGVLRLDASVDAFAVEDRCINRHMFVQFENHSTPILTSLDIVDDLSRRKVITIEKLFACRTLMLMSGYQLMPLRADELTYHIENAAVENSILQETAELRAIRESFLKVQMSKMLQIPLEVPWLLRNKNVIVQTLKHVWTTVPDKQRASAISKWLFGLLDIRGFAASATGNKHSFPHSAYASNLLGVIVSVLDMPHDKRDAFVDWIEENIVDDLKSFHPETFALLVSYSRELMLQLARDMAKDLASHD
ncbi:MAG: hypothetical protein HQL44_09290 [Alphaproteobacteria bacterium]|nr:hypothetical protein [Alphaproteobacteria bacterium]